MWHVSSTLDFWCVFILESEHWCSSDSDMAFYFFAKTERLYIECCYLCMPVFRWILRTGCRTSGEGYGAREGGAEIGLAGFFSGTLVQQESGKTPSHSIHPCMFGAFLGSINGKCDLLLALSDLSTAWFALFGATWTLRATSVFEAWLEVSNW